MSVHMTRVVWKLPLPSTEKLVLLALADCANSHGESCFPGVRLLEAMTGLKDRAIRYALKALDEKGLIERHERRRPDGFKTSNGYRLLFAGAAREPGEVSAVSHANLTGITCRTDNHQGNHQLGATRKEVVVLGVDGWANDDVTVGWPS